MKNNKLDQIIKSISADVLENGKNNPAYRLLAPSMAKLLVHTPNKKIAEEIVKQIYSLRPYFFVEKLNKIPEIQSKSEDHKLLLYSNLFCFAEFLETEYSLNLKSINEVYFEAALRGSGKNRMTGNTSELKGFENTSNACYSEYLYI